MRRLLLLIAVWIGCVYSARAADNLIFVTWDGFRWQEFFSGAEESLISTDLGGVPDVPATRAA